ASPLGRGMPATVTAGYAKRPAGTAGRRIPAQVRGRKSGGLVAQVLVQDGGDVALAEVRDDDDDRLALGLRAGGDLQRGLQVRAGRNAAEDALLRGELTGHRDGVLVGDGDDLVEDVAVEDLRHEVGAEALDLVRAGLVLGEQRGRGRLDGHQLHVLLVAAQGAAGAGNGAAGADARDEVIDVAVGVLPNLLAGG